MSRARRQTPPPRACQGVHMMFKGEFVEPWGEAPRVNRLVFIGKHLDRMELTASFESCMLRP